MKKQVLIIGAGPAGLTAAIFAAREGASAVVLEHTGEAGKKLLMTGNGRCNFSNTDQSPSHYHSLSDPGGDFIQTVLSAFSYENTIRFFRELGIVPRVKHYEYDDGGYVYPMCGEARAVRTALLDEALACNVTIRKNVYLRSVAHMRDRNGRPYFQADTSDGMMTAEALVIATGSAAAPQTGSDGSGLEIPAAFGHCVIPFLPSLCALRCVGSFFRDLKGVRSICRLTLFVAPPDDAVTRQRREEYGSCGADHYAFLEDSLLDGPYTAYGEVQFTDYGISGIPAFQLSRYVSLAVNLRRERFVVLDVLPDIAEEDLLRELSSRRERFADRTCDKLLSGLLPEKLGAVLIAKAGLKGNRGIYLLENQELSCLCDRMKHFRIGVLDTNGFEHSQCCLGGVSLCDIDPLTMESKCTDGLYFAGEVTDVDGDCGGYNLQWALSSGAVCGMACGKRKSYRNYPERFETGAEAE